MNSQTTDSSSKNGSGIKLFLHFLDIYHYKIARDLSKHPINEIRNELISALRLSFLIADEIYIPAAAYFENPMIRKILRVHFDLCDTGNIFLTSGDPTLYDHFEKKKEKRYDKDSLAHLQSAYTKMSDITLLYKQGHVKSAMFITDFWNNILKSGNLHSHIEQYGQSLISSEVENAWEELPFVLGDRAFVTSHVIQGFNQLKATSPSELSILSVLDPAFTLSYAEPLKCGLVKNLFYLQTPWAIQSNEEGFSYKQVVNTLKFYGVYESLIACSTQNLVYLKFHPIGKEFLSLIKNNIIISNKESDRIIFEIKQILIDSTIGEKKYKMAKNHHIGIVTALPEEWNAIILTLNAKEIPQRTGDPNRYAVTKIVASKSKDYINVVITFLPRVGTNSASTVTTNLLRSFPDVTDIIFSGIACGCPNPEDVQKHVRLGDIVVSDNKGVIQTDHQKIKDNTSENRSNLPNPSRNLINAVRLMQTDEQNQVNDWKEDLARLIKTNKRFCRPINKSDILHNEKNEVIPHPKDPNRSGKLPKIYYGNIGSSNTLLRKASLRKKLSDKYDLRAIEMEGSGIAETTWQFGKGYLVIRGICDYGDKSKVDKWHFYAAAAAAVYTKALLKKLIN